MKMKMTGVVMATFAVSAMAVSAAESAPQPGFKFQLGLAYVSGMQDLADKIELNNPMYKVDVLVPVGLTMSGYYDFANGMAFGLNVGPACAAVGGDANFYILPVGADVRYTFMEESSVSPYLRAGIEKNFVSGDFISDASVGFVGAVGLEFGHSKSFSWGVEAGYNSSEIKVNAGGGHPSANVKPMEFTLSVFMRF